MVEQQEHLCEDCGLPLVRKNGKGPWPRRCAQCKRKRHTAGRQAIAEGREPTDDEKLNPQPAVPQNPGEAGEPKEQDQQDPEPQQPQDASSPRRGRPLKPLKWFEHTVHPGNASADGPDDAQHIACRQAAYDAAVAQGLTPRGGWSTVRLLRIDTTGERVGYVYGAVVRP